MIDMNYFIKASLIRDVFPYEYFTEVITQTYFIFIICTHARSGKKHYNTVPQVVFFKDLKHPDAIHNVLIMFSTIYMTWNLSPSIIERKVEKPKMILVLWSPWSGLPVALCCYIILFVKSNERWCILIIML